MAFEFKFPDVGEGIHEGRIVEWLVREGETVAVDAPLVKVETDKAVVELPSPAAGTILKIHFEKDVVIRVGQVIVSIGGEGEKAAVGHQLSAVSAQAPVVSRQLSAVGTQAPAVAPSSEFGVQSSEKTPKAQGKILAIEPAPIAESATSPAPLSTLNSQPSTSSSRPLATPHTRALARKMGVDLAGIKGTGPHGRITDEDVHAAAGGGPPPPHSSSEFRVQSSESKKQPETRTPKLQTPLPLSTLNSQLSTSEEVERVPISYLRKKIAEHMVASRRISAHVTHVDEADVTELFALYKEARDAAKEAYDLHVTLLPFFIKALVAALREHPLFNASYDEEKGEIVFKKFYNFGVAVDTPEGLIVPVIKLAEYKSILMLSKEIQDLAARARERKLTLDELKGATITLTNIGPIGGLFATPIINQPNLAIVALGAVKDRPVVHEGAVAIRKMIYFSVSFDHRIIDGAEAARFANTLVRTVQKPGLLMAGV